MSSDRLAAATQSGSGGRGRLWRAARLQIVLTLATLALIEIALQVFQPAYLTDKFWNNLKYIHDDELGWYPTPNSSLLDSTASFMRVRHNSLGLRDVEYERSSKPTMLFIGDSLTWGYLVNEEQRFSNLVKAVLPGYAVVNAGIAGYGTDQEYLLLRRLWDRIEPDIVVLVICVDNDHADNTHNARYNTFKPYFEMTADGQGQFRGQPVPKSRRLYFDANWLLVHSWLARLAVSAYLEVRHPRIIVPDPTERLLGMTRDFVRGKGARFLVALQKHDPQLEAYLQREAIPFTSFDGAELLSDHVHWTAPGNVQVADRMLQFLAANGISNEAAGSGQPDAKP
jgi:hypothetical protein